MPINYHNLSPSPADSTNILLAKILQRLGGFAEPGDTGWDLLFRILALLEAASGGGDTTISGTLTVTGGIVADHILVTCTDPLIAGHAAIKGVGGNNIGVLGTATVGPAIKGIAFNTGVLGESEEGPGVRGAATAGNGVEGYGLRGGVMEGLGTCGLLAFDAAGGIGVDAQSTGGVALSMTVAGVSTKFFTAEDSGEKAYLNRKGMFVGAGAVPTPVVINPATGNVIVDVTLGCHFRLTMTGNVLLTPTGGHDGQRIVFELIQDGVGNRILSTGTPWVFGTDIPSVTLSTAADMHDFLTVIYNASWGYYIVVAFVKGYLDPTA